MNQCDNDKCACSSGIHGGMTFGNGELDSHGFWEFPCRQCAIHFDSLRDERVKELRRESIKDTDIDWATLDAWPYKE